MKLLENLTLEELEEIKIEIGEAFVTNELFHEWGELSERYELVMKYMRIYVQCVYESKSLYATEDGNAYIGVTYSDSQPVIPKIKLLPTSSLTNALWACLITDRKQGWQSLDLTCPGKLWQTG